VQSACNLGVRTAPLETRYSRKEAKGFGGGGVGGVGWFVGGGGGGVVGGIFGSEGSRVIGGENQKRNSPDKRKKGEPHGSPMESAESGRRMNERSGSYEKKSGSSSTDLFLERAQDKP